MLLAVTGWLIALLNYGLTGACVCERLLRLYATPLLAKGWDYLLALPVVACKRSGHEAVAQHLH